MTDRYSQLVRNPIGKFVAKNVGLPQPAVLDRYQPGQPLVDGAVLLGAAPDGRLRTTVQSILSGAGVKVSGAAGEGERFKALIFDATGIKTTEQLRELHAFYHPVVRSLLPSGRVIVLGTPPEVCDNPREWTAQRALEGFTRCLGKELLNGGTSQLVYVAPGAENQIESTIRFFVSPRSAYVSGQVVRVTGAPGQPAIDWDRPLAGKVALVTGASRGIGEAIAHVLARDGAHVVGLDVPALAEDLEKVTSELGGSALTVDITAGDAPQQIAEYLATEHGGVDIVVHNAGVTRDKLLANMKPDLWDMVIDINLSSEERINDELLAQKVIRQNGRIVCVSSIAGIGGNRGQTNYGTSKAGVIGMVQSMAPVVAEQDVTINAVAPGFIETAMTAKIPLATRQVGRLMNSMNQGGLPVDVAETIAWFASTGSAGLNGNVVRVCGQMMVGA